MSSFEVLPLDHIGAEIVGLDPHAMTEEVKRDLYATWLDHGVLLFREAAPDPEPRRIALLLGAVHDVIELDPSVHEGFDGLPGGSMPHLGRLVPWSPGDGAEARSVRLVEIDRLIGESHRRILFGSIESGGAS